MRKLFVVFLIILILFFIVPGVIDSYARVQPERPQRYTMHVVRPGDCFWNLSEAYMPKVDPRIGVRWIQEANGLEDEPGYVMQPGDRLNVPDEDGELAEPYGQD
ncbi:LysM peptidoglycan-binding domain-containing protein [Candidatus Formimonas warabiya]|uniref:LysM peptidoglycan-binding domain-containing protein n=1 Tax=Formimonas warabiya TaxID=1761012 RepID=A0A3G1KNY1_FORW1|nr:LysM domain-containing protein [Candidatus Formimonas warabiya]ATW24136.1 hypothetical protein DCMF_04480 [Candidatus Formimonas warabiya]